MSLNEKILKILFKKNMGIVIDIFSQMAITGENTDGCIDKGFLPVPINFYQPIPDIKDLEKRKVWGKTSKLSGIKFQPKKYLSLIKKWGEKYSTECDWPNEPTKNPNDFYLNNNCFSYGCASALHCIIRENKPKRIIEIGSGFSSKIIRDAVAINEKESKSKTDYIIIDPYSYLKRKDFSTQTKIIKKKVEDLDPSLFKSLKANDILFIDSSHVSKIGSDVNFEILEVLPILNNGVFIHFHDINLPYEYPKIYATNPQFRMFWTEAYLLQAFLSCNNDFKIVLPMTYVQENFEKEYRKVFPNSNKTNNFGSGSFWIQRINK